MGQQYESELAAMYTIGRMRISLFGGFEVWEIIKPDGSELCQICGPRDTAENLVNLLNRRPSDS